MIEVACPHCGKIFKCEKPSNNIALCPYCGAKCNLKFKIVISPSENKGRIKRTFRVLAIILIVVSITTFGIYIASKNSSYSSGGVMPSLVFNPDLYTSDVTYEDLARTPDEFKGKRLTMSGYVVQVTENAGKVWLRVATNGYWDDIIWLDYSSDIVSERILEGDTVRFYGTSTGLYEYQSVEGMQVIIPSMYIDHIERIQEK